MKGVLDSNKDIKKRMIFEVYEDGEVDMEFFGEPVALTVDLLDIIISIFASQEENKTGKNNEAIAKSICSYVLSSLNMVTDRLKDGAKMICVEGYKAFTGVLRVTPKCNVAPFEIYSDWLYKPDTNCWYGCGRSFSADICEVICEEVSDA